jgi:hypothetical protein
MAGAVRRLIFTNNTGYNNNHYVPGSGVGGQNIAVRRHLKRFATSSQGNVPCCPELLQNYGFIRNSPPGWNHNKTNGNNHNKWKQVKEIVMMQCIRILHFALDHEPEGEAVFRCVRVLQPGFARTV